MVVPLDLVRSSNSRVASTYPKGLVAVFVGATNGIGEFTLTQFAKDAPRSKVYFIGRTASAGAKIKEECEALGPLSTFEFVQSDISLMKNVDTVCEQIKQKEEYINLLFMTQGTLDFTSVTADGLLVAAALPIYSRTRFIQLLLPLLQAAPSLKRVVSVFTATKEEALSNLTTDPWDYSKLPMSKARGHGATMLTLTHSHFVKQAPDVTFIHSFPGPVKTGIGRTMKGPVMAVLKFGFSIWMSLPNVSISREETAARGVFMLTSARFPANSDSAAGVELGDGLTVARGIDGKSGSGSYVVDERSEVADDAVQKLIIRYEKDGTVDRLWTHMEDTFAKILGK